MLVARRGLFDDEQRLTVFDGLAVFHQNLDHRAGEFRLDLVHQLHGFDDAQRVTHFDGGAHLHERLAHREEGEAPPLPYTYLYKEEGELNRFSEAIDRLQEAILQLTRIGSLSSEASSTYQQLALDPNAMAKHTSDYVEQLGSLARNVTGLNALYELQLKSISSQIDTIDRINLGLRQQAELYDGGQTDRPSFRQENEQLLRQLQELNQAYTRMLHALNVQISSPQAESPVR